MIYTEEQIKVFNFVKYDSSHCIIDAVAGSGKTSTIIESASHIDQSKTVLFCAFNNSIAKEIANRFFIKGLDRIQVKTMHSLGFDLLKANSLGELKLENKKYDKIFDNFFKNEAASEYLEELCNLNQIPFNYQNKIEEVQLKAFLNNLKGILIDASTKVRLTLTKFEYEDFKNMLIHFNIVNEKKVVSKTFTKEATIYFELVKKVIAKGNELANKFNLIDFADMLYLPFENKLTPVKKFDLLFIDECQDLSKSQLAIALKYIKKEGRILSVGDPYQSIYGFTGADIESFNRIKNLQNTKTLTLSKCFRCPNNVIELAQHFRSDIYPFNEKQGNVFKIEFNQVIEYVKPNNLVISRTKAPLQVLMFVLIEHNINVEVHEDEIKEFINDLRYLFSPDELTERLIYRKGNDFFEKIRDRNVFFLEKKSYKFKEKEEKERFISDETNLIEAKLDFIKKQLSIHPNTNDINDLLKKIENLISGGKDSIKLSTIHRAKGLENDTVFILEYNTLPLHREGQKEWEKIQENNLKYVALTRTKKNLYLVNSEEKEEFDNDESLFDTIDDLW